MLCPNLLFVLLCRWWHVFTGQLEYASKQLMISVHAATGGYKSVGTGSDGGLLIPLDEMASSFWSDSAVGKHAVWESELQLSMLYCFLLSAPACVGAGYKARQARKNPCTCCEIHVTVCMCIADCHLIWKPHYHLSGCMQATPCCSSSQSLLTQHTATQLPWRSGDMP